MNQEQQEIRVGEVVRLNSGSPDLLVTAVSEKGIDVKWDAEGETRTSTFPHACLTLQSVLEDSKRGQ